MRPLKKILDWFKTRGTGKKRAFDPTKQDRWGRTEVDTGDMTSYRVSWNDDFERQVIRQCKEIPAEYKEHWRKEAERSTEAFRKMLNEKKKQDKEYRRNEQ